MKGRLAAVETIDGYDWHFAEPQTGMRRLDRHFESNGRADWATAQVKIRKDGFAKHFNPSCGVGEWRSDHAVKQPCCGKGKKCANRRTAESPTAVRVTSATDKITAVTDQRNHVFDRQDGPDFISREN